MTGRIHYTHCPGCNSTNLKPVMEVVDYTVSGEAFPIVECVSCTLRFTQDVPNATSISPYYKSEDYVSHSNASKGLVNRVYYAVRKRTMKRKRQLVEAGTRKRQGVLLDYGSGVGTFADEMKRYGWEVKGLEPDGDARQVAQSQYGISLQDTTELFNLTAGSFDAITLWHVLEHVHDLSACIQQLKQVLKDDGRIFIAVPNYTSADAETYREQWAAYDVPRHLYHFSPQSMQTLMQRFGMKVIRYTPMWYDSFYISLLSSKYRKGKTSWAEAIWNGCRSNLRAIGDYKKSSSVIYTISK
ncbi:MAG: class I SAM-dependent methyltransferase [Chitinophagaceae bacterium]|nr:MAG: class I SAM-dependent methyltransferase [Chitinophagaceae bacterium]